MSILDQIRALWREPNLPRNPFVDKVLFFVGALGAPIEMLVATQTDGVDLLSTILRALVFLVSLVGMASSFLIPRLKPHTARIAMVELMMIVVQLTYSCHFHRFSFDYSLLLFMVIPVGALFMVSPRWLAAYMGASIVFTAVAIASTPEPYEDHLRLSLILGYTVLAGVASFGLNYRTGRQLELANQRFRVLAEFSSDMIAMHDLKGRMWYVSPSCVSQTGYQETELIGRTAFELIHRDDLPKALEDYGQILEAPFKAVRLEYRLRRKDGNYLWVEAVGTPVLGSDGKITHVVTTTRDISKRKKAEQERATFNEELERKNRELDQFAYVVSHDLKAPLRGISTLTDFIEEDMAGLSIPDEVRGHLALMRDRTQRLERLIQDILAYSRAGRARSEEEDIDLAPFLKDLAALLGLPPGFKIQFEGSFPRLRATRVYLEQVFGNLINNAVTHHDQPTGVVTLSAHPAAEGWEIWVSDDGPGIDPRHHERVFEIFQQLKEKEGSTGIGLAVVRKIMETIGGKVHVESRTPRGCTFKVLWPTKEA